MEFYGMPESELDWMRWEAGREWTRQRLRVNNFTDDDFFRLLYREPRPQKMKKNKEEEEINNMKKKKKKKKNIQNKKKKDEYKKNKKRKREGVDCENNKEQEKEKEQEIKKEEEEECADDQPPAPPEEVEEEEEYDDFDERCAALPPPLLLAVKRVHMAMDMDKFKGELERSREPKKEEKEEKEECVDDQPPPEDFSRGMGMPRTKTQWLRYEAAMQWTHYRLRVKNFTDEDFARFLFREPRPQNKKKKKKIKKEEEEINNMKKKDESKKNRKRKREGNDDEKGSYGYGISSLMKEEEYDDFDERVAALPPSLLSAVKRVHMAMDMDTFKEDLERSRDMHEPKNGELTRVSESKS